MRPVRLRSTFIPALFALLPADGLPAQPAEPIRPVPIPAVRIEGGFWGPRLARNRAVTIPHIFDENEATGRIANFEKAAGILPGPYEGRRFNDTDVYKAIEAASYTLVHHPDPALEARIDRLVGLIAKAQEPDGYLFPARTVDPEHPAPGVGPRRWIYLNGSHELYDAGHLIEAAVANAQATGDTALLEVARKLARLLRETFGPSRLRATSGHEEIELALIRLYGETGNRGDLDLARYFLDQRGRPHQTEDYPAGSGFDMYNDRAYRQDSEPVLDQTRAMGHAVRAMYLYCAMADVARIERDAGYRAAIGRVWDDLVGRRLYATGAVGSRGGTEGFGEPFELPNATAYGETCASVGNVLWNQRMFLLTGDGKYLDVLERALYNGALDGVSSSGDRFFYENPLASAGGVARSPYFEVACCPANLARLLAQLPGLLFAESGETVFAGIYAGSRAQVRVGGEPVTIVEDTDYPWSGRIRMRLEMPAPLRFTLALRVPGWARGQPVPGGLYRFETDERLPVSIRVNGAAACAPVERGFARVSRRFLPGDVVELDLPMTPRRLLADPRVADDAGRVALERGPLVYAFEEADNGPGIASLEIPDSARLTDRFREDLLGGVETIEVVRPGVAKPLVAIPYFAWDNRCIGEMAVWVRRLR
jgi:DUF1680 family protein